MRKSFKLISGIKLNIGKKSISTTIGKRGLSLNTGSNGTFLNIGIPETGIRYRKKLLGVKNKAIQHLLHRSRRSHNQICLLLSLLHVCVSLSLCPLGKTQGQKILF